MNKEETQEYNRRYRELRKKNKGRPLMENKKRGVRNASLTGRVTNEWSDTIKSYVHDIIGCDFRPWLAAGVNILACLPDKLQREAAKEQIGCLGEKLPSPELCHKIGAYLCEKTR